MAETNKYFHLTLEERKIIQTGIEHGSTKTAIAKTIGKDKSTIGKEIRLHRYLHRQCTYSRDCANLRKPCPYKRKCTNHCDAYVPFSCSRRDRTPGACNKCPDYSRCHYDKYLYNAEHADQTYRDELISSREGFNLTLKEVESLASIIVPLIKRGLSPYEIFASHPELKICEKTIYNYIEGGVFRDYGLLNIDLRMKVARKMTKASKAQYKKREDRSYLLGRKYRDYEEYMMENPAAKVLQMDTIYNDGSNGPFMQTFKFLSYGFLLIIYHESKTSESMIGGVDLLESILGTDLFQKEVEVLLTDRGSEFIAADRFEQAIDSNVRRTHIFYCDPMASHQKGSLENNHRLVRYICPKECDLKAIGLRSQDDCNLITSHINSTPAESQMGKSPIEVMKFYSPSLWESLTRFGISEINKDKVLLKPYLLKK